MEAEVAKEIDVVTDVIKVEVAKENTRIDPETGEPKRPWTAWLALGSSFAAVAVLGVSLLVTYWFAISDFPQASWLFGQVVTEPGSGMQILLVVALTLAVLIAAIAVTISGFYGWAGYRWARFASLLTLGLTSLGLLLNMWTLLSTGFAALAAVAYWLPNSKRFFDTWQLLRHPEEHYAQVAEQIYYGPLPKYLPQG